ncbi:MAG: ferritin family protein [Anaerolineae bacterium]|nr:ferritin family protein [Anaerolineae bacterium]
MAVFTAVEALNIGLQIEKNGQAFYENAAKKMKAPAVKALMEDLARWEKQHYKTFQQLADQVGDPPSLSAPEWEAYEEYVQSALANALFEGPDKALAAVDAIENDEDALRMALGFEKDALLLYYDLRELMPEAERGVVNEIIREEKKHALLLAKLLRTGETAL